MNWLVPLPVAVPLVGAALIIATDRVLPRVAKDAIGVAAAASTFALGIVLCFESGRNQVVHWFGGWEPRGGLAIGIAFNVDPLGAAMCALAGAVVLLALILANAGRYWGLGKIWQRVDWVKDRRFLY